MGSHWFTGSVSLNFPVYLERPGIDPADQILDV